MMSSTEKAEPVLLEEGHLASTPFTEDSLGEALARLTGNAPQWQGIAYTTAGARSVRAASAGALMTRLDGADHEVPLGTVYELRLWAVGQQALDGAKARELRWLNGSGSAEISVHEQAPAADQNCWFRTNSYLQHSDIADLDKKPRMTSVEVFVQEEDYGNVVFTDELMTGRWA
ncbi:Hypothetical protein PROPJV5_2411 [Propionibacterium ruminifibrarum]|uniref:Uncharacterized protein n=1 Tax=Propionibacterium ruminifibrarum TaxID=1962131 RepID=A0A375I6E3_9ACTN|nr:hypothetical protein [Propionibacterium ruminifibrarum]SPF69426.1 Hypothetical protein PROPJV5_2411 [Propionibacterium ruminifibrarum]